MGLSILKMKPRSHRVPAKPVSATPFKPPTSLENRLWPYRLSQMVEQFINRMSLHGLVFWLAMEVSINNIYN